DDLVRVGGGVGVESFERGDVEAGDGGQGFHGDYRWVGWFGAASCRTSPTETDSPALAPNPTRVLQRCERLRPRTGRDHELAGDGVAVTVAVGRYRGEVVGVRFG